MKNKEYIIKNKKYVVSDDSIKIGDTFVTYGVNLLTLNEDLEVHKCIEIIDEKIVSDDMDLADPLGGSYFCFPKEKSYKVIKELSIL